jgi:hypothetical protein
MSSSQFPPSSAGTELNLKRAATVDVRIQLESGVDGTTRSVSVQASPATV